MSARAMAALRWLVFALAAFVLNFPVISTLITSLKSDAEISSYPGLFIEKPTLANYAAIFAMSDRFDILHYLFNSIAISLMGSALSILLAFPAAYAMVRFELGTKWMMPLVVNLRAIPLIIFAIPIYLMYQQVDLLDTRIGLALILCLVNLPLVLVLLSTSIAELPEEIEEAARVDGASTFQILWRIVAPISINVIAACSVLAFIYSWNEFLFGLMLTTRDAVPVTVGASFFFAASGGGIQWGMAASVMTLAALPPLVIGLVMYRRLSGSMVAGAVKG